MIEAQEAENSEKSESEIKEQEQSQNLAFDKGMNRKNNAKRAKTIKKKNLHIEIEDEDKISD